MSKISKEAIPSQNNQNMLKAGDLLKARRIELGKSIEDASDATKIQKRYLLMIEDNEFDGFESEVFLRGFLKSYSGYLGLKPDMMLAIYRRDMKDLQQKNSLKKLEKDPELIKSRISAKLISQVIIVLFVLFVTSYFFYQLYNFQKVPELSVTEPENNIETVEESVVVSGIVDDQSLVTINDLTAETDDEGRFSENIPLDPGSNTIRVKAVKENNRSKESLQVLTITRTEPEPQEELVEVVEEPEPTFNIAKLSVSGSEAWIQLLVDGKQELGQVVQPGFEQEYTVNSTLSITTGKTASTQLFINGETTPVQFNISDGIGEISCKLENNRLNCDN